MYTTEERLKAVKTQLQRYRRRRENYSQAILSGFCVLLALLLGKTILALSGIRHEGEISGMLGAIMLYEDIGSYVLVGVISFMVAVIVTLICVHYRKK